jgi:transposase
MPLVKSENLLRSPIYISTFVANVILDFIRGLRGELQVTFEEGTWATWLYDLLKPHVTKLVVCDPRKNSRQGNKNDRIDAGELSYRLYMNKLSSVYHGGAAVRTLRELARSYLTISKDLARVMSRVKTIYRSGGIPYAGKQVYSPRHRAEWLAKITEVGVLRRAEFYYQQLDALRPLRPDVRRELLAESKKHPAAKLLCQIPSIGAIRAALLIALIQTPHRFRTKRPLWEYSGFVIETHSSADYRRQGSAQLRHRRRWRYGHGDGRRVWGLVSDNAEDKGQQEVIRQLGGQAWARWSH